MDRVSPEVRSRIMSRIRKRNAASTEKRLRAALAQRGIRGWTINGYGLPGNPDIVFRQARIAIFVDGCFWHQCSICGRPPKSRKHYWLPKLRRNRQRDKAATYALRRMGWRVVRVWEHELAKSPSSIIDRANFG